MGRQRLSVSVQIIVLFVLAMMLNVQDLSARDGLQFSEIMRLGRGTAEALDWRPDGEVLAVGGSDGIIRVWQVVGE